MLISIDQIVINVKENILSEAQKNQKEDLILEIIEGLYNDKYSKVNLNDIWWEYMRCTGENLSSKEIRYIIYNLVDQNKLDYNIIVLYKTFRALDDYFSKRTNR